MLKGWKFRLHKELAIIVLMLAGSYFLRENLQDFDLSDRLEGFIRFFAEGTLTLSCVLSLAGTLYGLVKKDGYAAILATLAFSWFFYHIGLILHAEFGFAVLYYLLPGLGLLFLILLVKWLMKKSRQREQDAQEPI